MRARDGFHDDDGDGVLGIGGMETVYAATHRNPKNAATKMPPR
jgi:hypothetical protein